MRPPPVRLPWVPSSDYLDCQHSSMPAPRSVTTLLRAIVCLGLAVSPAAIAHSAPAGSRHALAVVGAELRLDGTPIKLQGLRTSAALMSDATTHDLIEHLDLFRSYGVNAVSVYIILNPAVEVQGASFGSQSSGLSGLFQHKKRSKVCCGFNCGAVEASQRWSLW